MASDGRVLTEHHEKATIIWQASRDRMGVTTEPTMSFDLQDLIQQVVDLDFITEPFSREEIDNIISKLPVDKSPGPDGFNGLFMKRFRHIISQDFYDFCNDFHAS